MKQNKFFVIGLSLSTLLSPALGENLLRARRIIEGLESPNAITHAPGRPNEIFINERKSGDIWIYDLEEKELVEDPFFTVPDLTSAGTGGLLGVAFHPDFETNQLFYTSSTGFGGKTRILEHSADTLSTRTIFEEPHPPGGHNGGWLGFGRDGMLYLSTGDGGSSGNDPLNSGQALSDDPATTGHNEGHLGCILRFDISADGFPSDPNKNYTIPANNPFANSAGTEEKEIWAYGLRNPWRCSFDSETGDLYIADVGQGKTEEVNLLSRSYAPTAATIANFGWKICEGTEKRGAAIGTDPCTLAGHVDPVFQYGNPSNLNGGYSITGGYVYRGTAMPWLRGTYLYGEFGKRQIRAVRYDPATGAISEERILSDIVDPGDGNQGAVVGFGEDADGEVYFCNEYSGDVYQFYQDPFSLWQSTHFSLAELDDPTISDSSEDPDSDGLKNLEEFVIGSDPQTADRGGFPFELGKVTVEGNDYFSISCEVSPSAKDISVVAEETDDLINGPWIPSVVVTSSPTSGTYLFRTNTKISESEKKFVRVRLSRF